MTEKITGGCLCGNVSYEVGSQPKLQLACHCASCRKHTGSAFSAAAVVPKDDIEIDGPTKTYAETSDSGNEIKRTFCPNCGSSVYSEVAASPDAIVLQVGTIDDPDWFKPRVNFYADSALSWVPVDPECKNFPKYTS